MNKWKIFLILLLVLIAIPLVFAADYGFKKYGCGAYGIGCAAEDPGGGGIPSGAGPSGEIPPKEENITITLECSQDSDCGKSQYCFENKCYDAECFEDSECKVEEGEVCWDYNCVKLFDMEILEFESPVKIGEFFNFTYFLKAVAEINGDVEIKFWIEQEGNTVTSGQDTIYFGSFEEKTKDKKLFLPNDISSGTYTFYIEVTYGDYTASAYRTIGIIVDGDSATIEILLEEDYPIYILSGLIGLAVLSIIFLIFYIRRKKLGKPKKKVKKKKVTLVKREGTFERPEITRFEKLGKTKPKK